MAQWHNGQSESGSHHSAPAPTALAESTRQDSVQACCSCVRVSARDSTVVSRRWARVYGWFRGPETPSICFLTVTECPSYTAVHRQWSGFPRCSCPHLEQSCPNVTSAPSMPVFWSRLKPGYSLQTFIHMTYRNFCSACAVTKLSFSDTLIVFFTFYLLYFV